MKIKKFNELDESIIGTTEEVLKGKINDNEPTNEIDEYKVGMYVIPSMSYGDNKERFAENIGKVVKVEDGKVFSKKIKSGKLAKNDPADLVIVNDYKETSVKKPAQMPYHGEFVGENVKSWKQFNEN
jgi:hypothetical protein